MLNTDYANKKPGSDATIIFYGAGKNARTNFKSWIDEGMNPVCFVDADIKKHHTKFVGNSEAYEILPLIEAISQYPDYMLYLTQVAASTHLVTSYLINLGIPQSRIVSLSQTINSSSKQKTVLEPKKRAYDFIRKAYDWLAFGSYAKRVLDLGCGSGSITKMMADCFDVYVNGVDVKCDSAKGQNWIIEPMDARKLQFDNETFDCVISTSTLEHLHDIDQVLGELHRVLKPNGRIHITGGPFWTSHYGHHYNHHLVYDPVCSILPHWSHLYMKPEEMRAFLLENAIDEDLTEKVVYHIYERDFLNRTSRSEILKHVVNSGFAIHKLEETTHKLFMPESVNEKLQYSGYNSADFLINTMTIELEKV